MYKDLKLQARALRLAGFTYTQISQRLIKPISKSTLNGWFKDLILDDDAKKRLVTHQNEVIAKARETSLAHRKIAREDYFKRLFDDNFYLAGILNGAATAKIALAMLYLGEGTKNPRRGGIVFGNSNPLVIKLFMGLFKQSYSLESDKFRCTVQCRADQDADALGTFWSKITEIPLTQFYSPRIDPRTIGKPSYKLDYKGVCRVEYLSARVFHDLLQTIEVLTAGR
jgi:hypothetical protein